MPFDFDSILAEPGTLPQPDTLHHDFLLTVMHAQRAERLSKLLEQQSHGTIPGSLCALAAPPRPISISASNLCIVWSMPATCRNRPGKMVS
jgi:hypothetical protein